MRDAGPLVRRHTMIAPGDAKVYAVATRCTGCCEWRVVRGWKWSGRCAENEQGYSECDAKGGAGRTEMVRDGTGWYGMVRDGTGWDRMGRDGTRWDGIGQEDWGVPR